MSQFIPIDEFIAKWKAECGLSEAEWAELVEQVRRDFKDGKIAVRDIDITDKYAPIYDQHYRDFVAALK